MEEQVPILKPDNNMALAVITTVCCCLPLGIVAIIKANSVDSLYMMKQYSAAINAANEAKKWSIIGIILSVAFWLFYILFWGGLAMFCGFISAFG